MKPRQGAWWLTRCLAVVPKSGLKAGAELEPTCSPNIDKSLPQRRTLNMSNTEGGLSNAPKQQNKYTCRCHCGSTLFKILHEPLEATATRPAPVAECNCSICEINGYLLIYVYRSDVEFIDGWETLRNYQFASRTRDHKFCGTCGTSVGIDFLGNNKKGDLLAINARIVEGLEINKLNKYSANGKNYQPEYNKYQG